MIFNFGSINVDHVYRLRQMPKPGETLMAKSYDRFLGGKGLNQSVAIVKSGGVVRHVGAVGPDGDWALKQIAEFGVDTAYVAHSKQTTGNAVIYVDDAGENQIVLLGGANQDLKKDDAKAAMSDAGNNDWLLFQNEINLGTTLVGLAAGCKCAYSAAPFDALKVQKLLPHLTLLAVNETEAADVENLLGKPPAEWNLPMVLITLGSRGARLIMGSEVLEQPAFGVTARDTTGAGDTFLGAFLARLDRGDEPAVALRYAAAASAIQVTQSGAAVAIPNEGTVLAFLKDHLP